MGRDVQFCAVRGHYCDCAERCDAERFSVGRPFRPTMTCDRCHKESGLYESFPHCANCSDVVCGDCGTGYDEEYNDIICHRCDEELKPTFQS